MIKGIRVLSGYALKLERLKSPIELKPGLNILFGPNGCGKSTTLKIAAAYCSIQKGGWTSFIPPSKSNKDDYLTLLSPGKCKAEVDWDGTPTLFADSHVSDQTDFNSFFWDSSDSPDGMSTVSDQMTIMTKRPSSGVVRIANLHKYAEALKNPPDITSIPKAWET